MKYPVWKPILFLVILGLAALFLSNKGLNKGIDLAGGTVLTYQVNVPEEVDNPTEAIDETITILADRVDPSGVMNLIWRRVGTSRVEVQMPLASDDVRTKRRAFENQIEQLTQAPVSPDVLDAALAVKGDAQTQELTNVAAGRSDIQSKLTEAAEAIASLNDAEAELSTAEASFAETNTALDAARKALTEYLANKATGAGDDTEADPKEGELRAAIQRGENMDRAAYANVSAQAKAVREAQGAVDTIKASVLESPISRLTIDTIASLSDQPTKDTPSLRAQAIEELKTSNPSLADQIDKVFVVYADLEKIKGPLDDPEDLKALLRGSGILEFRIAASTQLPLDPAEYFTRLADNGPTAEPNAPYVWRKIRDLEQWLSDNDLGTSDVEAMSDEQVRSYFQTSQGLYGARFGEDYYLLLGNTSDTSVTQRDKGWAVAGVTRGQAPNGFPAVNFNLNPIGANALKRVTAPNIGQPMAILLDGNVLTAPRVNSALSKTVQVTGDFSTADVTYLIRSMKAGSLDATLSDNPISEKTVGPAIGKDNLSKGLKASIIALAMVSVFMIIYYFFAGGVAVVALLANMLLILGVLAFVDATFTLPGIAGLVLTIGMAVDANVLIFERIREELKAGRRLDAAVREGYGKALSTILDANLTTLITCIVLGYTATADIKGFAVTLGIGIAATLFTALFGTKMILDAYVQFSKARTLSMLPMAMPALEGLLSPKVNWLKLRPIFMVFSVVTIGLGLTLVASRGSDMLDIEFRSGTAVSFRLAETQEGQQQFFPRSSVEDLLKDYADVAGELRDGKSIEAFAPEQQSKAELLSRLQEESNQRFAEATTTAESTGLPPELDQAADFTLFGTATIVTEGDTSEQDGQLMASGFSVQTLITDDRAVSNFITSVFGDKLKQDPSVSFQGDDFVEMTNDTPVFRISASRGGQATLGENVPGLAVGQDINVTEFLGGIAIVIDDMSVALSADQFEERIARIRRQPNFSGLVPDQFKIIGLRPAGTVQVQSPGVDGKMNTVAQPAFTAFAFLAKSDGINYAQDIDAFRDIGGFADVEWHVVREAMVRGSALDSVTKFSAQVSETMKQQAFTAMFLSLLAVVIYIWLRFGSFRYGLAAIICLVHDVAITLGLIGITGYLMQVPGVSSLFILEDFKINLAIVAALLTIVGYSLNDTIVIFDRIRENRGRQARATPAMVNDSINQTISRTILTSGTTMIALFVLYLFGGPGVHGFAFAMLMGVMIGTYSSIAIAAPILLWGYTPEKNQAKAQTQSTPTTADES